MTADEAFDRSLPVADARWFPVDLDVAKGVLYFQRLSDEQIEAASFLDNRLAIDWASAEPVGVVQLEAAGWEVAPLAWLWHTSFCGSTLLARMLHVPPYSATLREPLVLRRLADARDARIPTDSCADVLARLLSRPWHSGGRVLVKPTHAALNLALDMMARTPDSRAVFLTSSLEDFLISHLKKTQETLHNVALLAKRALTAAEPFGRRLGGEALAPPDVLCQCVLQWAAQREIIADVASAAHDRVRVLNFEQILESPLEAATAAADWLRLGIPRDALRANVERLSRLHAKVPSRDYDSGVRQAEIRHLLGFYADDIRRTLAWAERNVLPAMRPAAIDPADWRLAVTGAAKENRPG